MKDIKIWWTCVKCNHEFELGVSPIIPAKCGEKIDEIAAQDKAD